MVYPMFYLDEDHYDQFNEELAEIQRMESIQSASVGRHKIYVGSGEDANHAWEQAQNGNG